MHSIGYSFNSLLHVKFISSFNELLHCVTGSQGEASATRLNLSNLASVIIYIKQPDSISTLRCVALELSIGCTITKTNLFPFQLISSSFFSIHHFDAILYSESFRSNSIPCYKINPLTCL